MCDEDSVERVTLKMVNLDAFPEKDRNDENENIGNNSVPQKPIRKSPSAGTITTACSSSIGSSENKLPSSHPPNVTHVSSNISATLRTDSVDLNHEETLKKKLGNASGSEKSFRESTLYKRSPRNALGNSTDSSVADEKIGKKFSKYSPSYRHGILSQKDESGRKEIKSVDLKQKLTGTVTKRQKITSMTLAKAGSNHGAIRPISMSLARRKSVVSKRFDTDTLDLLESLNLINKNDSERQDNFEDDPTQLYFSPNGESNCDDGVYDDEDDVYQPAVVRALPEGSESANSFDDEDDICRKDVITFDKAGIPNFCAMDVIYEENTPRPVKVLDSSLYHFSTNTSPAKPKIKLNEIKARKLMRKLSIKKILTSSPAGANQIRGLLDGKGLLEFCTVDADLSSLLQDDSIEKDMQKEKKVKKSVYDVDDFTDERNKNSNFIASNISCIAPTKSHSAPSQSFSIEHIHDFCFPSGVPIHFHPQEKADRLTDTTDFDSFHTLQFTNGKGEPTYACCVITNIQYKPKSDILKKNLMRISIMNDAADKIIAIFRLYIAQRKWNQLRSGLRDSKASLTGLRFLPNSGGMSSYRTYGSNDTYSSNTSKSTTSGTAGGRKRSEGSLSGANSLGDKKPQGSATRSSKYFTAKHLKGLASKLLYGKPKSPVELRNLLTKEASKLQTRISMELNASDFNDREYVNNMKSGPGPGQGPGRSRKNSIAVLRNSGGSAGPVRNSLKSEKPLRPQSPQLTPHEGETSGEVRQRGSMDLGSDSASTAKPLIKEAGRQSRNTERSVSTSSIHSEAERNRIKSVESSMQYGTSISSSSFFSVHENKQKINEELKDRQKRDYRDIKMLLRDRALKSKEKSYVLVTQKAYCLICSEEKHSALFQILKMMLKLEREKSFFQELHGFEEQEDILGPVGLTPPVPAKFNLKVDTSRSANMTEDNSPCDSEVEEKTYVEKDVVLIEKFYKSREGSPTQPTVLSDLYSRGAQTEVSPNGSIKDDSDCTPERESVIETKRMSIEKFFLKREYFLLKVEEYLRKVDDQKSSKRKSTTKVTKVEKIDPVTNMKTTTTITETTVSEPIQIPSSVTIAGYAESEHLDFSSFPATKDWSAALLFATLSSEVLLKTLHLLLTEKSLIIYGADKGYVTATALAIKELLKPLTWEGIFVPMLSNSAKELFEAPVPFILGTTFMPNFDFLSPSAAVLHIQAPEECGPRSGTGPGPGPKSSESWNQNTSDKSDSFDTWKDCESNPKKQKKSFKSEKSMRSETFGSVQPFEDGERGTPRAWFLRLPDMEERMPSLPSLGSWIDRTRRFLSNSVVHSEMKGRKLREEKRQEKEISELNSRETFRRRFDYELQKVESERVKIAEAALLSREEGGWKVEGAVVRGEKEVQSSRERCFSIGAEKGRSSLIIPILNLSMRTPSSASAESMGVTDPTGASTAEYSDGEYEESPPRMESESQKFEIHSELLLKLEKARNSAMRCSEPRTELLSDLLAENVTDLECESGTQSPKRISGDENMTIKRRTVSFSLESFSIDSSEILRYSLNAQPTQTLHPEVPTSSSTATSPTNAPLFISHTNSLNSTMSNIGAQLGDSPSFTPSRYPPSSSTSSTGPNNTLTPDISSSNLVSISSSPLPSSYSHDLFPPTSKSPSTSEKSCDKDRDREGSRGKIQTDMGEYSKRTEAIMLMQAVEVASNYSPLRAQGNGKTWLEQIIKATDKPLRQTSSKRSVRSRRLNLKGTSEGGTGESPGPGPTDSLSPNTHHTSSVKSELSCYSFRAPALSPTPRAVPVKYPPTPPLLPFINGMSPMELRTTQKLVLEIRRYIGTFLGRAAEPNAWKDFVKYNRATNDDEFFPDLFLQPQRDHLEFQESLVKTQLFVARMDRLRTEYSEKESARAFISSWLHFRIYLKNIHKNKI